MNMEWYRLAINPQAILDWYTNVPSLSLVYLQAVRLYEKNAQISFMLDITDVPDKTLSAWKPEWCNTVSLQLDFLDVTSIQITRWSTTNRADIQIEQMPNNALAIHAVSASTSIQLVAQKFKIASVKCYRRDDL